MKELYPIGTVVKLKKVPSKNLYMIIGLMVEDKDGKKKDYISVRYPIGAVSNNVFFAFNNEDIEKMVFLGYKNDDFAAYLTLLDTMENTSEK